jgi:DeoR family glycerol-3-phosphate regulon repressor
MRDVIAEQRHRFILDQLAAKGAVAVGRLSTALDVSRETIRRDLHLLESTGRLLKRHGGAVPVARVEPDEAERAKTNIEGKRRIGAAAAEMVRNGASVILDSGTTARCVAEALADRRDLTVITNDLGVCARLSRRAGIRLVLLGGAIQPHEEATLGPDAVDMLGRYQADFAFVGAGAISPAGWLMEYTRPEADLYGLMLKSAKTSVVVADHSKFNQHAPVRVTSLEDVSHLVSDRKPVQPLATLLSKLPIELTIGR